MTIKRILTITALLLSCNIALSAQNANAKTFLDKGSKFEQQGDNLAALTCYLQARTADRAFSEISEHIDSVLNAIAETPATSDVKTLIKQRNDWDKVLLTAPQMIATIQPEFELHYFQGYIDTLELTEKNYQDGTMSFKVPMPYLVQKNKLDCLENKRIAWRLLRTLKGIEQSKNWGEKINGFPLSYAEDISGDNYLKKILKREVWNNTWHNGYDDLDFTVSLCDENKKELAKVPISFRVEYTKLYIDFPITSNNIEYDEYGRSSYNYEKELLTFNDVDVNSADVEKLTILVTNSGKQKASVKALAPDIMPINSALEAIEKGNHDGILKIAGYLGKYSIYDLGADRRNTETVRNLDISELIGITNLKSMKFSHSLESIVLPNSIEELSTITFIYNDKLAYIVLPSSIYKISTENYEALYRADNVKFYYKGAEAQWKEFVRKDYDLKNVYYNCTLEKLADLQKEEEEQKRAEAEAKAREEAERLAAEQERIAAEQKAKEERKIAEQKKKNAQLAESVEHPEKGVPFEPVPYVIQNLKSDAKIKVTGEVPTKKLAEDSKYFYNDFSSIADALKKSEVNIYLDLSAVTLSEYISSGFEDCTRLVGITIPTTASRIYVSSYAFENCTQLASITIPANVTSISMYAFKNCTSLKVVNYCGSKKQWKDIKIDKDGNKPLLKAKINYDYKGE